MNPYTHALDTENSAVCGEPSGHGWHRRTGTPMCDACRAARAEADKERAEARRDGIPHAKPATVEDILKLTDHRAKRAQLQAELNQERT